MQNFKLNTIAECKEFNEELINGVFFDKQDNYDKVKVLSSLLRVQTELIKLENSLKSPQDFVNLPTLNIKIEK